MPDLPRDPGDRPWPVPPPVADEQPAQAGNAGRGRTTFRIVLLLGLLGAVTAVGVIVGQAIEPTATAPPLTTVTKTVPPPAPKPRPAPKVVKPVVVRWGPLRAEAVGHLPAGGGQAGTALVGRTLVAVGGTGSARIVAGPPGGQLTVVGALSAPRDSMAVFASGGKVWALGGETAGKPTDAIQRIDLTTGAARPAGTFEEPLADAGVIPDGASVYLLGGWTGTQYASAVLQFTPPSTVRLVARLPQGVRSAAVARVGNTVYVAGGRTDQGPSNAVYAVDLDTGSISTVGQLPQPVEGAVLLPLRGALYLLGGRTASGRPSAAVVAIDPSTGTFRLAGRLPKGLVGGAAVPAGARPLVVDATSGTVYRVS
jgi:hypothetical protein